MWIGFLSAMWLAHASHLSCEDVHVLVEESFDSEKDHCLSLRLQALVRRAQREKRDGCLEDALRSRGFLGYPIADAALGNPSSGYAKDNHKEVYNPFGGDALVHETDNFAIWWGEDPAFSTTHIEALGVNFEKVWSVEIEQLMYPHPEYADTHKMNVFIGDTDSALPSAEGNAGFFWYDGEGKPMMVLSKEIIAIPDSAKLTAAHEFFHAVQSAVNTYRFEGPAMWYMEATANWILEEVFPDDGGYSNTLYSVAMRPEVSLNHFGDYLTEGVEADHHYGAFIFATYLSEHAGGPELIRETFVQAPLGGDPLLVIADLLEERGSDMHQGHLDYALHNATWDYRFETDYELSIADSAGMGETHRVSGQIDGLSDDWVDEIPYPPQTYGANYWRLTDLPGRFMVEFEGAVDAKWSVGIAQQSGEAHAREIVFFAQESGSKTIEEWTDPVQGWLVVSAIAGETDDGLGYSYRFRIATPVTETILENEEDEETNDLWSMGCQAFDAKSSLPFFGLIWFLRRPWPTRRRISAPVALKRGAYRAGKSMT